ncbi:hypothetical protein BGX26_002075 [Mortierella sp. AD094]|nr:hypothetical protein BGX26_002075 [Mortierella sp. AD094]
MTNQLKLFCLVDGEPTANAFPLSISSTNDIGTLKEHIKTKKSPKFDDIAADELTLWRVSVPVVAATKHSAVLLKSIGDKEELLPTDELSDIFNETPAKKTIHIQHISALVPAPASAISPEDPALW